MTVSGSSRTVLVVDDEPGLAELYAAWLAGDYHVRTAHDGREAIEEMSNDVAVALIDRMMPVHSGDEVLDRMRSAGYDCRVAMVTAVEPDFDILEMGFDDYLVKPVRRGELQEAVASLFSRTTYDTLVCDYFALVSKRAALETRKSTAELEANEAYAELLDRIEVLSDRLDRTVERFDTDDLEVTLRRLGDD